MKKKWFAVFGIVALAAFFHKPLLLIGSKAALNSIFPKAPGRIMTYESLAWEGDAIALTGFQIKDPDCELTVDRVEMRLHANLLKFQFKPDVSVMHPQIVYSEMTESAPMVPFLYRTARFQPRWDIKNGVIVLPSSSRFYFSMAPEEREDAIGKFVFSYDTDPLVPPVFSADLSIQEKMLQVAFQLRETDLGRLLPLTALILPEVPRKWECAGGELELEGVVGLDPDFKLEQMHFLGAGKEIMLIGKEMAIACEALQGTVSYPSAEKGKWWEKVEAELSFKNGSFNEIQNLEGEIVFNAEEEPHLHLTGNWVRCDQQMAFDISGKGRADENCAEIIAACKSPGGQILQGVLSISHENDGDFAVNARVDNATYEHWEFFHPMTAMQCVDGALSGEATFRFKNGQLNAVACDHVHMEQMGWYFPEEQATVISELIAADGFLRRDSKGRWDLSDLRLHLTGGDYVDGEFHVNAINAEIVLDHGVLFSSKLEGNWEGLHGQISFGKGKGKLKLQGEMILPIDADITAVVKEDEILLEGQATFSDEIITGNAQLAFSSFSIPNMIAGKLPSLSLKAGQLKADALSEKSFGRLVRHFAPECQVRGFLQAEAAFYPSRFQVQLSGNDMQIEHAHGTLSIPSFEQGQFVYDGKWQGKIPLSNASLQAKVPVQNIETTVCLEGDQLKASSFYAEVEGLALRGAMDFSLDTGALNLSTSQIAGDLGGLLSLMQHLNAFPGVKIPLEGTFSSGEKGFVLASQGGQTDYTFKGDFENLSFPINDATRISDGRCEVLFDSKTKSLKLAKGEGLWHLIDGTVLGVQLKRFSSALNERPSMDFALKVVNSKKELIGIEGTAASSAQNTWEIVFDPSSTHVVGGRLNITRCTLNNEMQPVSFEMRPTIKCQDLAEGAALLQNAGFMSLMLSPMSLKDWQLDGTLQARLSCDDKVYFMAESRDLKVKGDSYPSFALSGEKIGDTWRIDRFQAGNLFLKGSLALEPNGFSLPQFEGNWQGIALKGSGFLRTEQKRFSCTLESVRGDLAALKLFPQVKGSFSAKAKLAGDYSDPNDPLQMQGNAQVAFELESPLFVDVNTHQSVAFSYDHGQLSCKDIDLKLSNKASSAYLGSVKIGDLQFKDEFALHELQFALTPSFIGHCIDAKLLPDTIQAFTWEGELEGSGDLTGTFFQANLKPGKYGYDGRDLAFEQLQLRYEKDRVALRGKTQVQEHPLWALLQLELSKEPCGALKLFDHPKAEGMKIVFRTHAGKIAWESIQGNCYGLKCKLNRSDKRKIPMATVLSGEIGFDGSPFLPKELDSFKFGKGYAWKGDIVLWHDLKKGFQANGTLSGRDFEAFGYCFKRLEGELEAAPDRFILSDLKIEDPAGAMHIKKIAINKDHEWNLDIPLVAVRQLQPSMLRKIGEEKQTLKPFIIQNFTMTDIRGELSDLSTLVGTGRMSFVNQFKKEASLFDLPLELIKKIGLDLGLLTPVQGELDLELHGDKCYLMALKNAFSDGNRSEFYLAPSKELSYIDLEGKMHIDLKMRQDVMLKITEPFTLTIRGTLEKPRYGLVY